MEWRVMVRLNVAVPVEYEELVMGGWISREQKIYQGPGEYNRYIFEAKITPLLHGAGVRPLLFWMQRIPDLSIRPKRPPMYSPEALPRKPFSPEQRQLHGYDLDVG
jgi:hypothetical protein